MTDKENNDKTAAKYGAKLFGGEYKAAVVVLLNEDDSYDVGFVGGLINCLGLLRAADANLTSQLNEDA